MQALLQLEVARERDLGDLPFERLANSAVLESPLETGERRTIELAFEIGGRLEIQLAGRDPALSPPAFELVDTAGDVIRPAWIVRRSGGHESVGAIEEDGPLAFQRVTTPGTYRLRQTGSAYLPAELEVRIEAQRVRRISFNLERAGD